MYRIHRPVAATQHHRTPVLVATMGIAAITALLFLALSSRLSTSFAAQGSYQETNLSSGAPAVAAAIDPNLLNAGGMSDRLGGQFLSSANHSGFATANDGAVVLLSTASPTPSPSPTSSPLPTPSPSPTASPPDLVALVKQLLDDENRGDLTGALALFTDDAVIDGGSCTPACVGKAAIQQDIENGVATHTEHVLADSTFQVSGNTVTAHIEHRNDASRAAGVDRFFVTSTVEFTGAKISHISPKLDTSDAQTATFAVFMKAQRAGQLPATGGEPSSSDAAGLPLFVLFGIALVIAGGFSTALGMRRRG